MPKFESYMENEDKTPFSITGDIPRRSIVKYHKMLDLKDSKINFKPKLCLVCCNDVSWIDGKDLYEVLEDKMRDIKFDCELKKFGTFKDVDGMNIVYIKIELPQTIKQLRQEIFKRIKYVGSDTAHDKTNTPHIEIARFKGKVPTLPTFEPETMSIKTLRFLYEGNVKLEQTF